MKKIFLDPGHGGTDSGAVGVSIVEKDYNLLIATKVMNKLKNYECEVYSSRTSNKVVSLDDRCKLSNSKNCDIFVSIHCNSSSDSSATGFESFSFSGKSSLQKRVHDELVSVLPLRNRGMKKANFYVLKHTKAKAILLELGFISNIKDCNILHEYVDSIVNAIVKGIIMELGLTTITSDRDVYRVVVGSYTEKKNAENMLKYLEKDGYKPVILKATI